MRRTPVPTLVIRNYPPVHGLLVPKTMQQVRNNLAHLWKVNVQGVWRSVFRETRFEDLSQVFGYGHEVGHVDIERGKRSHCCVEVIAQTHVYVADLALGHLNVAP